MPDVKLRAVIEASAAGLTHALDEANQAVNQAGKSWSGAFRDASGTMKLATESAKALGTAIKSAGELDPEALKELQPTLEAAQSALEAIDKNAGASARSLAELGAEAARLRIPVAEWDAFKRASSEAGISAGRAAEMIRNLRHSLSGEGAEQARASLESLGVSLEGLSSGRGVQQAFQAISRSLMDATDRSSAATASMRLLGASLEEVRNLSTSLGKAAGGGLGSRPLATEADVNQAIKFGQALDNLTDQMAKASNEMSRMGRTGAEGAFKADLNSLDGFISRLDEMLKKGASVDGLMRSLGKSAADLSATAGPDVKLPDEARIRKLGIEMVDLSNETKEAIGQFGKLGAAVSALASQGRKNSFAGALDGLDSGGEWAKRLREGAATLSTAAEKMKASAAALRAAYGAGGGELASKAISGMTMEKRDSLLRPGDLGNLEKAADAMDRVRKLATEAAADVGRMGDAAKDLARAMAETDVRVSGPAISSEEAHLSMMADKARDAAGGAASLNQEIERISAALGKINAGGFSGTLVREMRTTGEEAKKMGRALETVDKKGVRIQVNSGEIQAARKRLEELKAVVERLGKSGGFKSGNSAQLAKVGDEVRRLEGLLGEAEKRFGTLEGRAHGFRRVVDGIAHPIRTLVARTGDATQGAGRLRRSWEAVRDAIRGASTDAAKANAKESFGKGFFSTAGHSAAMAFGIGSMAMLLTRVFRSIAEAGTKLAERLDSMAGRKGEAEAAKWDYEMYGRRDYEDRRKRRDAQSDVLGRWIETRAREQEPGWEDSHEQMAERIRLRTEARQAGVELTSPGGIDLSLGELAGQAESLKRAEIRDLERQAEDIREVEAKIRATLEGSRQNPTEAWRKAVDATVSVITEIKGGFQNLGADWDQQFSREERAKLEEMARWADQRRGLEERAQYLRTGGETELQGRIRTLTAGGSDKALAASREAEERDRQERIRSLNARAERESDPVRAARLRHEARREEIEGRAQEVRRKAPLARGAAVAAEFGRSQRLLTGEREAVEDVQAKNAPRYGRNEYAAGQIDMRGLFGRQQDRYGALEGIYRRAIDEYTRRLDEVSEEDGADERMHLATIIDALKDALHAVSDAKSRGTIGDWAGRAEQVRTASDRIRSAQAAYGEFLGGREASAARTRDEVSLEAERINSRKILEGDLDKAAEAAALELERLEGELEAANASLERAMAEEIRARREYANVIRDQARQEKRERLGRRRDRLQGQRDDIRRRLDRFGFRPYEGFKLDESARRRRRRRDNFKLDEGISQKMARSERGERVHWTRRERERIGEYQRLERRDKALEAAQKQIDAALKSMDAADRQRQAAAALERAAESMARAASGRAEARADVSQARDRLGGHRRDTENERYDAVRSRLEAEGRIGNAEQSRRRRNARARMIESARDDIAGRQSAVRRSSGRKATPEVVEERMRRSLRKSEERMRRSLPPHATEAPAEWMPSGPSRPKSKDETRKILEGLWNEERDRKTDAKTAEQKQTVRQTVVPADVKKPDDQTQKVRQQTVPDARQPDDQTQKVKQVVVPAETRKPDDQTQTVRQTVIPADAKPDDQTQTVRQQVVPAETRKPDDQKQKVVQNVVPVKSTKPAEQKQTVRQQVIPAKEQKPKTLVQTVKQEVVPAKPRKQAKAAEPTERNSRTTQRREERREAAEQRRQRRVRRTGHASLYNRPEGGNLKLAGQPRQGNLKLAGGDFLKNRRLPNLSNKAAAKGVDQSGLWQRLDLIHADLAKIAKNGATIV